MVVSSDPHAIGKLGSVELGALRKYLDTRDLGGAVELTEIHRQVLFTNAGVFPNTYETLERYAHLIIKEVLPEISGMVVWFNIGEANIVKSYCSNYTLIRLGSLSSYLWSFPWTKSLAGKKVLVVHPFVETIRQQYSKRSHLWPNNPEILPDFDLDTLHVPMSPALVPPKHKDWFKSLDILKDVMSSKNFDVALIGAGAYSLPLVVHAKKLGRKGIHTGGETQFFFGIKGGRWDKNPFYSKYYNEHWIRTLPEESPPNNIIVEDGCYW
jgi:hypothetical protein